MDVQKLLDELMSWSLIFRRIKPSMAVRTPIRSANVTCGLARENINRARISSITIDFAGQVRYSRIGDTTRAAASVAACPVSGFTPAPPFSLPTFGGQGNLL